MLLLGFILTVILILIAVGECVYSRLTNSCYKAIGLIFFVFFVLIYYIFFGSVFTDKTITIKLSEPVTICTLPNKKIIYYKEHTQEYYEAIDYNAIDEKTCTFYININYNMYNQEIHRHITYSKN